jgi:hypothetical protein
VRVKVITLAGGLALSFACASSSVSTKDPYAPPFNGPFHGRALRKEAQPQVECEYLMMHLKVRENQILRSRAEFLPMGSAMSPAGEVIDIPGETAAGPQTEVGIVAVLEERLRQGAKEGRYKATALAVHMRVTPQGKSATQDAIAYRWDHRDGYSAILVFPYYFLPDGSLRLEDTFFLPGENRIFPDILSCDLEQSLRSTTSDARAVMTFVNQRSEFVELFWLDFDGHRKSYGALAPGATTIQQMRIPA